MAEGTTTGEKEKFIRREPETYLQPVDWVWDGICRRRRISVGTLQCYASRERAACNNLEVVFVFVTGASGEDFFPQAVRNNDDGPFFILDSSHSSKSAAQLPKLSCAKMTRPAMMNRKQPFGQQSHKSKLFFFLTGFRIASLHICYLVAQQSLLDQKWLPG